MSDSPTRTDTPERQRGAVLVEFAFIALLMYLLMAVTVDFGRLFYSAQAVQDAAAMLRNR